MLRQTFLHLPGVGERTERRLWENQLRDWQSLLEQGDLCRRPWRPVLEESLGALSKGDWRYFERSFPSSCKWRAYADLGERALYVDIETDGGAFPESITVIGTYDGREYRSFVRGVNLPDAADHLAAYPLLVTFNGARFDMPLIRGRFRYNLLNHVHVDLLYPLRRLGIRGGLKAIELQLGIERSPETRGMDGWEAVRLWSEYHREGSQEALELLLKYNQEDVRNLKPLMDLVFSRLAPTLHSGMV